MKAIEIMNELFEDTRPHDYTNTCDTCKSGDPEIEVKKLAVAMFATPDVIRSAAEWGAELMIVHEPLYYNHMDVHSDNPIECAKRRLIEESGLTIWRYHDHAHYRSPDYIAEGELAYMGIKGKVEYTDVFDLVRITPDEPLTARELAKLIETKLGIAHVKICGAADRKCSAISCMFGAPGGVIGELKNPASEIVITGETSEWAVGEYARDAASLGFKKALLILGHIGSERDGMKLLEKRLAVRYPHLETRYFECGEVCTYTE